MLTSSAATPNVTAAVARIESRKNALRRRGTAGSVAGFIGSSPVSVASQSGAVGLGRRLVRPTRPAEAHRVAVAGASVALDAPDRVAVRRRAADDLVHEVLVTAQAVRLEDLRVLLGDVDRLGEVL